MQPPKLTSPKYELTYVKSIREMLSAKFKQSINPNPVTILKFDPNLRGFVLPLPKRWGVLSLRSYVLHPVDKRSGQKDHI